MEGKVLWIISDLGYLYCVACAAAIEARGREVREGDPSFGSDTCDRCCAPVGEARNGQIEEVVSCSR